MRVSRSAPWLSALVLLSGVRLFAAEPLPNTKPLTAEGDLALKMVEGIHKYLDRELEAAPKKRDELWKANIGEPVEAKRKRLRAMLGVIDERVKPNLEYVGGPGKPALLCEVDGCRVYLVRWAVLPMTAFYFVVGDSWYTIAKNPGASNATKIPGLGGRGTIGGWRPLGEVQIVANELFWLEYRSPVVQLFKAPLGGGSPILIDANAPSIVPVNEADRSVWLPA